MKPVRETAEMPVKILSGTVPPILVEDSVPYFEGRAPFEMYNPVDYETLRKFYGVTGGWNEEVLALLDPVENISQSKVLRCGRLTSIDILAKRKNILLKTVQLNTFAVVGVVVTSDNQVIYCVRGGEVTPQTRRDYGRGMFSIAPAGQITWNPNTKDVILDAIRHELFDELGFFEIGSIEPLGIFSVYEEILPGLKVAYEIRINASFADVVAMHERAVAVGGTDRPSECAIAQLKAEKLPVDYWEHSEFRALPYTRDGITRGVDGDLSKEFIGAARGALELLRDSMPA